VGRGRGEDEDEKSRYDDEADERPFAFPL